jgi:hypothetical protein
LYHERVKIPNRFREQIWKNNIVEMKVQIVVDVVLFCSSCTKYVPSQQCWSIYVRTSNFRVEPIRSVPLYCMATLHSMVTIIEAPFTTTPTCTIASMRSKPQTPRGTNLASMHIKMPREVDMIFLGQPSNLRGGGLGPPGPSRYLGLLMVNLSKPPLLANRLYR